MKRYWSLVLAAFCSANLAFGQAQVPEPPLRAAAQAARGAQGDPNNRALQAVVDVYITNFTTTVGLSDEQYLKIGTFVRQFIQTRFRVANQRALLNQRRTELLAQAEPSESEVQLLTNDLAQLERNAANAENGLLNRIRPELTPRQVLLVGEFNKTFFEQRLPQLLERARAEAAARGRQGPATRPNANKNKSAVPAGDSFRTR